MPTGWFLDSNLLVLLVVGITDQQLIGKHRRLKRFTAEDYERLIELIASVRASEKPAGSTGAVLVTPNTLTETSNLLAQHEDPERSRFLNTLRSLIEGSKEVVVNSGTASRSHVFTRLGLTDAALLEVVSSDTPLVTVDLDLYIAVATKDHRSAVNFTHYQRL